jgi:Zn-finger in ubiquitin-hydrolases and other protein
MDESPGAAVAAQSDAWMAHKLYAKEQLTGLYGFPADVAEQAVDFLVDITSTPAPIDVAECCAYILDSGLAVDQGGPITPISNCPHVLQHCSIALSQLPFQPSLAPCSSSVSTDGPPTGNAKSDAAHDDVCAATENWLCLECAVVRCSRYCQGHAQQHWQDTVADAAPAGHCLAVSLSDLSVWCFRCQAYLSTSPGAAGRERLVPLLEQLERGKSMEPATWIGHGSEPRSSKKLKQDGEDSSRPIDTISEEEEKDDEEDDDDSGM